MGTTEHTAPEAGDTNPEHREQSEQLAAEAGPLHPQDREHEEQSAPESDETSPQESGQSEQADQAAPETDEPEPEFPEQSEQESPEAGDLQSAVPGGETLLGTSEVADELDLSERYVRTLCKDGEIKADRGERGAWIIRRQDLDAYIAEQEEQAAAEAATRKPSGPRKPDTTALALVDNQLEAYREAISAEKARADVAQENERVARDKEAQALRDLAEARERAARAETERDLLKATLERQNKAKAPWWRRRWLG